MFVIIIHVFGRAGTLTLFNGAIGNSKQPKEELFPQVPVRMSMAMDNKPWTLIVEFLGEPNSNHPPAMVFARFRTLYAMANVNRIWA